MSERHPQQPIEQDEIGTYRFKQNAIVRYLLDAGSFDMNAIALLPVSNDDRSQFAQLIGYSVCGFGDLPYTDNEQADAAQETVDRMIAVHRPTDTPAPEPVREALDGPPWMPCCGVKKDSEIHRQPFGQYIEENGSCGQRHLYGSGMPEPTPIPVTEQGEERALRLKDMLPSTPVEITGLRDCGELQPRPDREPSAPSAAEPIDHKPNFFSSGPALTDEEIEDIDTLTVCGCVDDDPDGCLNHHERERCPRPALDDIGAARLAEYYPKIVATLLKVRRDAIRAAKQETET